MPVVFSHEELAAVHWIVVAVRADFAAFDPRRAVSAFAGVWEILLLVVLAGEEMRDRHRHEVASVDRTFAWILSEDRSVVRARLRHLDADRLQDHFAFPADAGLVFDNVLVARHRADVRHRHFLLSRLRPLSSALLERPSRLRRRGAGPRRVGIAWNYFTEVMTPRAPALVASASSASSI